MYEIKLSKIDPDRSGFEDYLPEPTGKKDGEYEIYSLLTPDACPDSYIAIQQVLIDNYNLHMHQLYEKPEWFDANGFRVANPKTNSHSLRPAK